jgi:hypothetical protein
VRAPGDSTPADRCPGCGLLFDKWLKQHLAAARLDSAAEAADGVRVSGEWSAGIAQRLLHVEPRINVIEFWVRVLALAGLSVWGVYFVFTDWASENGPFREIGNSFMHNINLVFHEAGHILFIPLGNFMSVIGGSLGQLIMPLVVLFTFLLRYGNTFGAAVALWWFAQSCMDLAPYIGDARAGELLLLGGVTGMDAPGYHDWSNILRRTGMLRYDRDLAAAVDLLGELLMWTSIVWAAAVLYRQYQNLDRRF